MTTYTDRAMESAIGRMLRIGVAISAGTVLIGGLIYLSSAGTAVPDRHHFTREKVVFESFAGILRGVGSLNAASIIQLGLLLLIATPVIRVVFCVVGFARQRDCLYVTVSAIVLLILLYSLFQYGG